MVDAGKIQGSKLNELFAQLVETKTIISMYLVGTGFERLTCVTGIMEDPQNRYLLIDRPDGFGQAAAKTEKWRLRFNFNGPDKLEYIFSTSGGSGSGRELKIPFPDYVERLQRRKNFRILTMPGTRMLFKNGKIHGIFELINISIGGALAILTKHNMKESTGPIWKKEQRLYDLGIIFPATKERKEQVVVIKKAEVRRIEHDKEQKLYRYAFEFMEIDGKMQQKLTQAIYHLQRHYLQNR